MDEREKTEEYQQLLLALLAEKSYEAMKDGELLEHFQLKGKEAALFLTALDEAIDKGLIICSKKGKYLLPAQVGVVTGILSKHRKGFGFILSPTPEEGDVFVSPSNMNYAMNGDLVAAKLLPSQTENSQKREGMITSVLKRNNTEIVGTFTRQKKYGFVVPDDPKEQDDIFIAERNMKDAQTGDKVVASITLWPAGDKNAEGTITEIISRAGEKGGEVKALIRQKHVPVDFPPEVIQEAQQTEQQVERSALSGRTDFRDQVIITIDGADSKDFDDAVSVVKNEKGNYVLAVHIADVCHYVKENSPLDKEALKRGNSIYLLDTVIPMLPKELSNGICSLNPDVDRLTLSVVMEIDSKGHVVDHTVCEGVIRSKERMVYTDVSDILENDQEDLKKKYEHILPDLYRMQDLAAVLRSKRDLRGSLDFDLDEARITLNEEGIPISVETAERRTANKMIEEFMLLANETVAEHFYWLEAPFVYRIHEKPSLEKMEELRRFLAGFGLLLKGNLDDVHPRVLGDLIHEAEGKPFENVANTVILRSMKKAFYGVECEGHFGLGVKFYCHFTSPIRRYPDLMIHRVIKEMLQRPLVQPRLDQLKKKCLEAAEVSSKTERDAQELERDVEKLKMSEYMSYHIGEEYEGVISGVANFGFFVELENTVEGMVRAAELQSDFYDYEPEKYRMIGRRTNQIFALGQKVTIVVQSVDVLNREINFMLTSEMEKNGGGPRRAGARRRKRSQKK